MSILHCYRRGYPPSGDETGKAARRVKSKVEKKFKKFYKS